MVPLQGKTPKMTKINPSFKSNLGQLINQNDPSLSTTKLRKRMKRIKMRKKKQRKKKRSRRMKRRLAEMSEAKPMRTHLLERPGRAIELAV